ncbi:hypothetical protein MBLNU230_g1049t1 [Neophaeotheca triangularis]
MTDSGKADRLSWKQSFYGRLEQPSDDEQPDTGRLASVAALRKQRRGVSARGTSTRGDSDKQIAPVEIQPPRQYGPLSATGKRKRNNELPALPEEQQIFKDLHFYFFPNSDGHPARRMRINKALQFGATWQKDWSPHVTHVVVDSNMDYALLMKYLKLEKLPEGVILVNENFPPECISYRSLLDPTQFQFRVKGHVPAKVATIPKEASTGSDVSLKLKPAGKAVTVRLPETQSSTEGQRRRPDTALTKDTGPNPAGYSKPLVETASTSEFDAAIKQAKELHYVPLDDEETPSRPMSADGLSTDDEDAPQRGQGHSAMTPKKGNWQDKFQCMTKHTGESPGNPNLATIAVLQQMAEYYGQMGDEWRIRAYRKAISTLRNQPRKICTKEEALALPNVGARLAEKIEEIAITNKLRRLDNARAEPGDQVLRTFMQVYGAGHVQASKWVNEGYTTLDELYAKANLTDNQRIGVEHYNDFLTRIPRAEVQQHGAIVREALQKLDPRFEVIVGGSYRRGSKDSGDIDCIITHPTGSSGHLRTTVLNRLVPSLTDSKFLVASLAITSRDDGSKWHGASCLPNSDVWRRLDLLIVPPEEIGAALIYFTGNDIFNRSLRLLASKKGMRLNQRGLYKDIMRGKDRTKLTEGTLVEGRDETKIFEALGVPWRPPEHRIC